MTIASYLPGDPRLSISEEIASKCLDEIRETFKNEGLTEDSYLIVMTAIALYKERENHGMQDYNCLKSFEGKKGTRQILNYKRLSDEHLAYLYAEAIKEVGIDGALDFKKVSELWSHWVEEGLKIMYCDYYLKYYPGHGIEYFLQKLFAFVENQ
jgi:hypothetical protein